MGGRRGGGRDGWWWFVIDLNDVINELCVWEDMVGRLVDGWIWVGVTRDRCAALVSFNLNVTDGVTPRILLR